MDFFTIRVMCCNFLNLYGRYVLQYKSILTIFSLQTQHPLSFFANTPFKSWNSARYLKLTGVYSERGENELQSDYELFSTISIYSMFQQEFEIKVSTDPDLYLFHYVLLNLFTMAGRSSSWYLKILLHLIWIFIAS